MGFPHKCNSDSVFQLNNPSQQYMATLAYQLHCLIYCDDILANFCLFACFVFVFVLLFVCLFCIVYVEFAKQE